MKLLTSFFLAVLLMSFFSCKKNSATTTPKTRTQLITGHTWVYDEYFTNYNTANTLLAYKRGKANNSINLSLNRSTFNSDGTTLEINQNGQSVPGTWKFINNETQTQTINAVGTFSSNIILLNDSVYIWFDPVASSGTYARMVPQ